MRKVVQRNDLLYPNESYRLVGLLFNVYNELGPGHHEKYYQRALEESLRAEKIPYKSQFYVPLIYKNKVIGKQYFDFLVDDKIILELKKGDRFSHRHIKQVSEYLKMGGYRLAIIANFGSSGISFKRIVNYS